VVVLDEVEGGEVVVDGDLAVDCQELIAGGGTFE
jgi:hypothetical protein